MIGAAFNVCRDDDEHERQEEGRPGKRLTRPG